MKKRGECNLERSNFKFIFCVLIFFFMNSFYYSSLNVNRVKKKELLPGTKDYENYLDKEDLKLTINSQRAWIFSAILPGIGQIYNHQYIKAVCFYGLFASLFGGVYYCQREYMRYIHDNNDRSFVYSYKKVRDGLLFVSLLLYVSNILDAYVGSEFSNYDVSKNIGPIIINKNEIRAGVDSVYPLLSCSINFL